MWFLMWQNSIINTVMPAADQCVIVSLNRNNYRQVTAITTLTLRHLFNVWPHYKLLSLQIQTVLCNVRHSHTPNWRSRTLYDDCRSAVQKTFSKFTENKICITEVRKGHSQMNPRNTLPLDLKVDQASIFLYRGTDKTLARPGRKQSRKHVRRRARFQQHRDARCHHVFLPARQGAEGNSHHSDINISLFPSWSD